MVRSVYGMTWCVGHIIIFDATTKFPLRRYEISTPIYVYKFCFLLVDQCMVWHCVFATSNCSILQIYYHYDNMGLIHQ